MLIIGYGSFMSQTLESLDERMILNYYSPVSGRLGEIKVLGIAELQGYGRGGFSANYPTLFRKQNHSVKVLVYECNSAEILKAMHKAEIQSGYKIEFVQTPFGAALVWIKPSVGDDDKVKDHTRECYMRFSNQFARETFPELFQD
jgi:hypothetical protein